MGSGWEARLAAVRELGRIAGAGARAQLEHALLDEDTAVIDAAAEALFRREEPEAVPAILRALGSDDDGGPEQIQQALAHLRPGEWFVLAAAEVLRRSPDADLRRIAAATLQPPLSALAATPALLASLDDPDFGVRQAALESLHAIERADNGALFSRVVFEGVGDDGKAETAWALKLGPRRFDLMNIPVFAAEVSFRDEIEADDVTDPATFLRVIARGGHSTYRIAIQRDRPGEGQRRVQRLSEMGCGIERLTPTFLSVDVPGDVDVDAVYAALEEGMAAGAWLFDEMHHGHELPGEE